MSASQSSSLVLSEKRKILANSRYSSDQFILYDQESEDGSSYMTQSDEEPFSEDSDDGFENENLNKTKKHVINRVVSPVQQAKLIKLMNLIGSKQIRALKFPIFLLKKLDQVESQKT